MQHFCCNLIAICNIVHALSNPKLNQNRYPMGFLRFNFGIHPVESGDQQSSCPHYFFWPGLTSRSMSLSKLSFFKTIDLDVRSFLAVSSNCFIEQYQTLYCNLTVNGIVKLLLRYVLLLSRDMSLCLYHLVIVTIEFDNMQMVQTSHHPNIGWSILQPLPPPHPSPPTPPPPTHPHTRPPPQPCVCPDPHIHFIAKQEFATR